MDPTMLYNGVHLQRKKRFTVSPLHNLNSTVEMSWPESLHHEELSPTERIKKRQSMEAHQIRQKHNTMVGHRLAQTLNLTDSRLIKYNENKQQTHTSLNKPSDRYKSSNPENLPSNPFKLPKVPFSLAKLTKEQYPEKRNNIVSELITDRNKSYFTRLLREKLKKYDFQ